MDWVAQAVQPTRWLAKVWRFYERVSSTQDEAKAWVQQGAPHGGMVIAEEQTKGRGRWGRTWFSPPRKNLHLTLTMKLPAEHPPLGTLSLLTGVAIVEALRQRFSVPAFVKWVNDVVVDGKKLAGILIEGRERLGAYRHRRQCQPCRDRVARRVADDGDFLANGQGHTR